jgi:DNA-directed RNA polymerase specialized sigma24 family protein
MRLHKEWLQQDLEQLEGDRFAIKQLREELITVNVEYKAIKATNYDKVPSGSSNGNTQRDKLENAIAKKEELSRSLRATERHVADMERLLNQLQPKDREIIEKLIIKKSSTAEKVAEEIGIEVRQVHNRKRNAIERLTRLRFGQGYRP